MKNKNRRVASFLLALCLVITNCSKEIKYSDIDMLSYADGADRRKDNLIALVQDNLASIDGTGLDDVFNIKTSTLEVLAKDRSECSYVYPGSINDLANQIVENSQEYASQNDNYLSLFDDGFYNTSYTNYFDWVFSEEDFAQIKDNIFLTLESYLSYIYSTGNREDIHNLKDLKIVMYADKSKEREKVFGDYDSIYNLIRIDFYNILDSAWEMNDILGRFDEVIKHEINHALAHSCLDKAKAGSLDEIDFLNGQQYTFLTEASAESSLYNLGIASGYENRGYVFYYVYDNFRDLESKLLLCSLFDNSKTMEDYYRNINSEDINAFLEFLGAETLEEKAELFRVVYAMDALEGRNDYFQEIIGTADTYTSKDILKVSDNIKFKHYISILKYSVRSLIDYNVNSKLLSLDDNLLLYYIVLSNIVDGCFLLDDSNSLSIYYYYEDFIKEYKIIEDNYFGVLSKFYGKRVEEIKELFESYKDIDINKSLCYLSIGNDEIDSNTSLNEKLNTLLERFPKLKVIANLKFYNGYVTKRNYIKMLDKVMSDDNKDKTLKLRR